MTKDDLLKYILASVSDQEWEQIKNKEIIASDFNYRMLEEIKTGSALTGLDMNKEVDQAGVSGLEDLLKSYLGKYMADRPQGWKWIILGCLYNSFIKEQPMHPIDKVDIKVVETEEGSLYFCPAKEIKPDSTCNYCVCRKMSNYEITKRKVERDFKTYNHQELADKLGLKLDDNYLYIRFVDRDYKIHRTTGQVSWDGHEADFNVVLTIYDILCYSKPHAHPAGEYVLLPQLSKVQNASSYAGEGFFVATEKLLSGHEKALEEACIRMGGVKYGKGDVSYKLPFYEDLNLVLSFWSADDEFPAQLQYMFDKNSLDYMHYETCWYAIGHITDRIKEYIFNDQCKKIPGR